MNYHCLANRMLEPNNDIDIDTILNKLEKKGKIELYKELNKLN